MLKELTNGNLKSHPPTPKRALSSNTSTSGTTNRSSSGNASALRNESSHQPKASSPDTDAPVKAPRGKLTVKIIEARGLRKSRDPYVVAVFQRNELVSKGPPHDDAEEDEEAASSPPGADGIPISRQDSDSGRPMAIPMRSRQSSSTSLTEQREYKRNRKLMTDPKWDTEAVL